MMDIKTKIPPTNDEPTRKCSACVRMPVCQIFRVEVEYIKKEFEEKKLKPPFNAEQLAAICGYFLPLSAVRLSTGIVQDTDEK